MLKLFTKKAEAINYLNKKPNNKLRIIGEDINNNGSKKFTISEPKEIFNKIIKNKENNYYEFWTPNTPLVFGIDLDLNKDIINNNKEALSIVKHTIRTIKKGALEYYNHNYNISDIIVLENEKVSNKYSFHIICRGLVFKNHLFAKDFFHSLKKIDKLIGCDDSIYNLTCLRMCFCSKKGKNAILLPIQLNIDNQLTCYIEEDIFSFWQKTMLTHIEGNEKIIDKKLINDEKTIKITSNNFDIDLKNMLFKLPSYFYEDYDKWINVGMILFNNNPDNNFELWKEWSKQSNKYNDKELEYKWKSFNTTTNNKLSIGTLFKWCKDLGIIVNTKKNRSLYEIVNEYPTREINFQEDNNTLIINEPKLSQNHFIPYLQKKVIAVQSEKGTGKTTNLLKSLFECNQINDETSILFISSRRTFGIKLLGDLNTYGFKLYSDIKDPIITDNRIICQVDSLIRLSKESFDIVIIDECESLARYLSSSHFIKNDKAGYIISMLEMRINNAEHIYILDADLSDRSFTYIKNIINLQPDEYQKIINIYKPYSDYQIVPMKYEDWLSKIIELLNENKKLVIPMASNNKAKDLVIKLEMDYPEKKILLIHKETSDDQKMSFVINVNDKWSQYDIVIYTPSVSMGISFDIPDYFDNIMAFGCHNSVGAQEFAQMIHRVRTPKEKKIYLAIDYYRDYNEDNDILDYDTVETMLCSDYYLTHYELHNNVIIKKVEKNKEKNEIVILYPYKEEPIYDIYIRNSWETLENKFNFPASFFGYTKYKNYQIVFENTNNTNSSITKELKDIRDKRLEDERNKNNQGILSAADLTYEEYLQKIKQKDEYLTDDDYYAIQKYNIKKCYQINNDDITENFLEIYNERDKMKWYKNLSTIKNSDEQSTDLKLNILKNNRIADKWINNCFLDFSNKNNYTCHYYALEILKIFKLDINDYTKTINKIEYNWYLNDCIKWLDQYRTHIVLKYDLKTYHKNLLEYTSLQQIQLINSILFSMYGIKIKILKNSVEPEKQLYGLIDDNIWSNLPHDIISIELVNKNQDLSNREHIDLYELDVFN